MRNLIYENISPYYNLKFHPASWKRFINFNSFSLRISSFSRNIFHIPNLWFLRILLSCVTIFGFDRVFPYVIRVLCVKNSSSNDQKPQNKLENFLHVSCNIEKALFAWRIFRPPIKLCVFFWAIHILHDCG